MRLKRNHLNSSRRGMVALRNSGQVYQRRKQQQETRKTYQRTPKYGYVLPYWMLPLILNGEPG